MLVQNMRIVIFLKYFENDLSTKLIHSLHLIKLQDELKIDDDEFEDLQSLYKLFDLDRDGILNFKEYEKLLRCLGYRLNGKKTTFKSGQHD